MRDQGQVRGQDLAPLKGLEEDEGAGERGEATQ
jgi:hypothetical protein